MATEASDEFESPLEGERAVLPPGDRVAEFRGLGTPTVTVSGHGAEFGFEGRDVTLGILDPCPEDVGQGERTLDGRAHTSTAETSVKEDAETRVAVPGAMPSQAWTWTPST